MAKRTNISLQPPPEPVVRKDSVKLSFRLDIECTKESANAMRHYLKVAERCYAQGREVYSVTIEEIA